MPPRNLKAISVQNQFLIQSKFCCDTLKLMGLWFSMNTCCQCSESCLQLLPAPAGSPAPALQGVGAVCYLLPPAGAPRPDRGNPKTLWLGCWLCPIPRMVSADTECLIWQLTEWFGPEGTFKDKQLTPWSDGLTVLPQNELFWLALKESSSKLKRREVAGQAPQPCTGGWGCHLASRFFGRLSLGAGRDFLALAGCVRVAAACACIALSVYLLWLS